MDGLVELEKAGKIASEALQFGKKKLKPGIKIAGILDDIEEYIREKGAEPAFPAQISINEIAAHQCNVDEEILKENDVVKLDVGVSVNGYIADNAITICLNKEYKELINATDEALKAAIEKVKPGVTIGEIGKTIQEVIESKGYKPVRNLSGHGLGRYEVHKKPTIPNIDTKDETKLEEGQVIAIEPFASTGSGNVYESGISTIYSVLTLKPVRSMITRNILKEIRKYNNLPFTTRWLNEKFGEGKTRFALKDLEQRGMIRPHPPLADTGNGIVSQSEHTVIVKEKPIITTKNKERII